MAKIWRNRLIAGTQVFSDCPLRYQKDVLELLEADVDAGVISRERYDEIVAG